MITHSPIIEDTIKNGGGTYRADLRGKAELPATGYIIGVASIGKVDMTQPKALTKWLSFAACNALLSGDTERFIGTWVNDGICYIDIVQVMQSRHVAHVMCQQLGELAYYDIAAGESVNVADVPVPMPVIKLQGLTNSGLQQ